MIVLNTYGAIETICISQKLKLYISNLPCSEEEDWNTELQQEMKLALAKNTLDCSTKGFESNIQLRTFHAKQFPNSQLPPDASVDDILKEIADNMVCLYFNYEYEDMPMGDWTTNCFDGRFCEEDYAEKIVDLLMFISHDRDERIPSYTPQWIYSSNEDTPLVYRFFWGGPHISTCLDSLLQWGSMIDNFLEERDDYLQLDFLANAIHEKGRCNTYHFLRSYSVCQLLLEKEKESELDWKLPLFLDEHYTYEEKVHIASLLRRIRNKIAHGDFVAYEEALECYAVDVLGDEFDFDYSELSRHNWCLLNSCCKLDDAIRRMLILALTDKKSLRRIKNAKASESFNS